MSEGWTSACLINSDNSQQYHQKQEKCLLLNYYSVTSLSSRGHKDKNDSDSKKQKNTQERLLIG